jgi:hypothetical protein
MKKKQIPRSTLWPDNPSGAGQSRSDDNKRKNPQPLHLLFSAQAPLALGRKGWATSCGATQFAERLGMTANRAAERCGTDPHATTACGAPAKPASSKSRSLARLRGPTTAVARGKVARDDNRSACRVAERCGTDPHATTACGAPAKPAPRIWRSRQCRLENVQMMASWTRKHGEKRVAPTNTAPIKNPDGFNRNVAFVVA